MNYLRGGLDDFTGLEGAVNMGFMGAKVTCPVYMKVKAGACVLKTCNAKQTLNLQTGKCVKTPAVAVQCPANSALETQARASCAAQNLPITISNCSPFEYVCGTAPVNPGSCSTAPYTQYNDATGQCCEPGTALCIGGSIGSCVSPYMYSSNGQCYNPNIPCGAGAAAGYYMGQTGQCEYIGTGGVGSCTAPYQYSSTTGQCYNPNSPCGAAGYYMTQTGQCQYVGTTNTCASGWTMTTTGNCVQSLIQCPAGTALNQSTSSCVQMGSSNCPTGQTLTTMGQCVYSSIQCPSGYQLNQSTNQCVNSQNICPQGYNSVGQCIGGGSLPSYVATGGAYVGGSAYLTQDAPDDGSDIDASEVGGGISTAEYAASSYAPQLSPVSQADMQYNTMPGYEMGAQAVAAPTSGPCPAGTNAGTSDQWGSFTVVQTVCAQSGASTAAANAAPGFTGEYFTSAQAQSSGGYPSMTEVEQGDIATLTGLGFLTRNLG